MGYFRELPELYYQSFLSNSNSSQNYLLVKNLFRRGKLRDDLQNVFTIFNKYEIVEGARPDTVAEEMYGSAELDWVVLMTAGIVNARDEWPLSDKEIYEFLTYRYGDFILLKPALKLNTVLLWMFPFVIFLIGLFIILKHN